MLELTDNAKQVLERRYLLKNAAGAPVETPEGLFRRVANAVAEADTAYGDEAGVAKTAGNFYELMTSLRFLPNSPTLMNAGRPGGQLSACFVLPVEDDMEAIFEAIKNAALIHKSGGGTGFSFSRLRPNGSVVNTTGGVASGPVSFMRVFNMATEAVKQGGMRRGANMGILRVDHPDILEFIRCKSDHRDITNFNLSVGITAGFMEAAARREEYDLIDPHTKQPAGRLNAGDVFDEIVDSAWQNGEPGIIFLDRLNNDNPVPSLGEIESTNPCGEQPLLPFESCNLGSINLVKVLKSCDNGYKIDWPLLTKTVHAAVHFLDNVIDVNTYPLEKIAETTKLGRKIGLGVMGFADMLLLLGQPYNSAAALKTAKQLMSHIRTEGRRASEQLATKRGAFPLFGQSIYKNGPALRNATITTIAPTGTLSIIAGCSSGVEPVFAYVYIRNIMDNTKMIEVNPILEHKLREYDLYTDKIMQKIAQNGTLHGIDEFPEGLQELFVSAHDIDPTAHIMMQAAFQQYTDNAVSKTVNFPSSATHADVAEAYRLAWENGCKGVTIYRDGSRENQVLSTTAGGESTGETTGDESLETADVASPQGTAACAAETTVSGTTSVPPIGSFAQPVSFSAAAANAQNKAADPTGAPGPTAPYGYITPRPRPPITSGFTERMKIGCGNLYVTVNYDENGICEVFTSTGKAGGCPSQSEATARLCSVALRSGMSVEEIATQLKGIRCPSTIRQAGMNCTSCPDAIAKVILKVDQHIAAGHASPGGGKPAPSPKLPPASQGGPAPVSTTANGGACPECGVPVRYEGGCTICPSCGFSRCG